MMLWGVLRDDELYEAYALKYRAEAAMSRYKPGSKHKWRVAKIIIEAWHDCDHST